jgi:ferritin-like metal-binding protein YciE
MQTAHEFFLHELNDMLDAEQKLVEILGTQAEESTNETVRKGFEQHQKQTEGQVERLRNVFESLGEEPEQTECAGIKGLKEEHDNFKEEDPSEDILDVFNVGAAIKVERYEISAYESLVRLAQQMGHKQAVKLLTQNMKEEQQTLKKLETASKKLEPENLGMSEDEDSMREMEEAGQNGRKRSGSRSTNSRRRRAA